PSPTPPTSLFFFNDTPTTKLYTLSLHDALPIYRQPIVSQCRPQALLDAAVPEFRRDERRLGRDPPVLVQAFEGVRPKEARLLGVDRKSTRLNSSHVSISYAVFCLKKKKRKKIPY